MTAADYAVQIKLIIMDTIGILVLLGLFFYLHHLSQHWLTKFSLALLGVIIFMVIVLIILW